MSVCECKIMLVGRFNPGALECSYEGAFREIGCTVGSFDIAAKVKRHCRLGAAGSFFNKFVPVEPWVRKANREMVLYAGEFQPDVIVIFGQNPVRSGALAQIRAMYNVRMVYIWPDTLVNLNELLITSLPLYDLVATYSKASVSQFERLGACCVKWIPLGGDPQQHSVNPIRTESDGAFDADISFIGRWRPEREQALTTILSKSQGLRVKIWGPDWGRRCRSNQAILQAWQKRSLYGSEFARAILASKINLNVIDPTNYPAANMRFFEIPCAGGVQLCSPCPEMEAEFKHEETIFYYQDVNELPGLVHRLLSHHELRQSVARAAHEKVLKEHTYAHRARKILSGS